MKGGLICASSSSLLPRVGAFLVFTNPGQWSRRALRYCKWRGALASNRPHQISHTCLYGSIDLVTPLETLFRESLVGLCLGGKHRRGLARSFLLCSL